MLTRRKLAAIVAVLVTLLPPVVPAARAEVSVETDAYGQYVRTIVLTQASIRQYRIWRVARRAYWGNFPLNPDGDRNGDLFPAVAENPVDGRHPWAVWSRFNGYDYDLAWSKWERGGWTPITWIGEEFEPGDDLAPTMGFHRGGRPYVAWWRDEGGVGRIYLSFFLVTRWLQPLAISDAWTDSRSPRMSILDDGSVRIAYRTPAGPEERVVSFLDPTTITDDLNPVSQMSVSRITTSRQ
jgi:hypothetical protein